LDENGFPDNVVVSFPSGKIHASVRLYKDEATIDNHVFIFENGMAKKKPLGVKFGILVFSR
jgi:hypothetical protein